MGERDLSIAILGAGFAGIGTAIRLKQAGIESFTIFERSHEIGGTWRDNTYPGAACDVPSHVYSLSFEPNPGWTRKFSPSSEIQAYLLGLVEKWQLRAKLRLRTEIVEARFDEPRGVWTLTTAAARRTRRASSSPASADSSIRPPPTSRASRALAARCSTPRAGTTTYDLAGRNVGVIGTGASAVQVVPSIAPQVAKLSVFQRTPAWVVPKLDKGYSKRAREIYARHPLALRASRLAQYGLSELLGPMIFLDSKRLSALGEGMSRRHLRAQVADPELRRKLTPGFQFGCKRILISDDYWASFERENVELVTEPIAEIRPGGIETKDGRLLELDAIVLATGFTVSLARAPFPITGRGGRSLDEVWQRGAVAYKGMTVSGFPNWFILMGPNTGPGHTSVLVFTEAQIEHVVQAIRKLRDEGLRYVDVRQDVQDRYNAGIQARMPRHGLAHLQELVPLPGRQQSRPVSGLRRRVRAARAPLPARGLRDRHVPVRMKLRDLGEFGLIERIARAAARRGGAASVVLGIGDDAALLRIRARRSSSPSAPTPASRACTSACGARARARSDAARSWRASRIWRRWARARSAACSRSRRRPGFPCARLDALVAGLLDEAARHACPLVGGNLSRARELSLTLTVFGAVARGRGLRRAPLAPGDRLFVTGTLGGAALERARVERGRGRDPARSGTPAARRACARRRLGGSGCPASTSRTAWMPTSRTCSQAARSRPRSILPGCPLPPGFRAACAARRPRPRGARPRRRRGL